MNYYNEFDPNAAAWLRQLIAEGLIPPGEVDQRSIIDVKPHELTGYTQQHFFCGIGGWPLALRLAGWPDTRPVRTGSCPCQPFSQAGQQRGEADERHVWPFFRDLTTFGEPTVTFGEQVASRLGREWLSGIRADLEGLGYAVGAADLCAAGQCAPHIRQRLYWVADLPGHGWKQERQDGSWRDGGDPPQGRAAGSGLCRADGGLANAGHEPAGRPAGPCQKKARRPFGDHGRLGDPEGERERPRADSAGRDGSGGECLAGAEPGSDPIHRGETHWSGSHWISCRDGKHRRIPTEPALFPLADGLPYKLARRGSVRPALLKGAGNAIVPQVAAGFIRAYLDARA